MDVTGSDPIAVGSIDYRHSHLHKGADYDLDLMSDAVSSYMDEREKEYLARFLRTAFPRGVGRYLDFACGTGRITELAAAHARESLGIDVSQTMIARARERCPAVHFVVGDITRERPAIGRFDLVTAFRFFGNAQDELRESALHAIAALLVPGGYLVLNNHRNPWAPLAILRRCTGSPPEMDLSYPKLRRLLDAAGFALVSSHGIGGWWIACQRMSGSSAPSPVNRAIDAAASRAPFVPFCPDAVLVARKKPEGPTCHG